LAPAQLDERGHQVVIERKSPLAVVALGFFDPDPVVDEDPRLVDGEDLSLQVDVGPAQAEDLAGAAVLPAASARSSPG
jgi:hypothetical protein